MKKIVLTILAVTMVAVGCGTPKVEVPKARESEGILLQAYGIFVSVYQSLQIINNTNLLYLTDSFDIDAMGETSTFDDFDNVLWNHEDNSTIASFIKKYSAEIDKGISYGKCYEMIKQEFDILENQEKAIVNNNTKLLTKNQQEFLIYTVYNTVKEIMDGKNFDRIARMYEGNEFEDTNNKKGRLSRYYRSIFPSILSTDKVFKAKVDVMIDDSKSKGDGKYYQTFYDMLTSYLDDLRDKVKEGPYRDFVK